jgi:GDP-L-fucose synthase
MKILLLGHSGFLGSHVHELLNKGSHEIHLASKSTGIDLRNYDDFERIVRNHKPDTVINCAAHVGGIQYGLAHQAEIYSDNLAINLNLYELARSYKFRVLNPISNCAYPTSLKIFREDELWSGEMDSSVFTYGAIRRLTVVASHSYWNQYKVESINLIFPNLYGEGDHLDPVRAHALGALVFRIIEAKYQNAELIEVWGTGAPVREWLHVDDAAKYIVEALELTWDHDVVNVGWGEGVSIANLALMIKNSVKYDGDIRYNSTLPDGAPCKIMDASKSTIRFRFKPEIDLPTGILRTTAWYEQQLAKRTANGN